VPVPLAWLSAHAKTSTFACAVQAGRLVEVANLVAERSGRAVAELDAEDASVPCAESSPLTRRRFRRDEGDAAGCPTARRRG